MESLFFNIGDKRYKTTRLYEKGKQHITRVDISNGIVFFDICLSEHGKRSFDIKNLDRMVVITVVKEGGFTIRQKGSEKVLSSGRDEVNIYCSSRQDFVLTIEASRRSDIFVLCIADFFLKRYLSLNRNEPIDFLYEKIQGEIGAELVDSKPLDALTLHIIDKIIDTRHQQRLHSIKCEHSVIEFMIHRFSLICLVDENIDSDELEIAHEAQKYLLNNFVKPPTIPELAHICATNETKLKRAFKKVYKTTIGGYIRKLRLERANLLLKDRMISIGEVAREVGYNHQGYFGRLFFEAYGIYPKDLK
ncbi:transcriptional regulator, AraC family [Hydrogenimonas sp.]|nr:transcriptional regulator, AraC family [Hydrogenimonas sp.]